MIVTQGNRIFDAAKAEDWDAATTALSGLEAAWTKYDRQGPWPRLNTQMSEQLATLKTAIASKSQEGARQAAIHAAGASLDFQLRYRTPAEVDMGRLDLSSRRLGIASDVLLISGGVAIAVGVYMMIAHPGAKAAVRAGLTPRGGSFELHF